MILHSEGILFRPKFRRGGTFNGPILRSPLRISTRGRVDKCRTDGKTDGSDARERRAAKVTGDIYSLRWSMKAHERYLMACAGSCC